MGTTLADPAALRLAPTGVGLDDATLAHAAAEITAWPDYAPSPLLMLPGLARRLGLGAVMIKDEGARFGLGGVKVLGAPYGLLMMLRRRGVAPGTPRCAALTAIAATDGNHGLAMAWAAQKFGCGARVYVGRAVDAARLDLIAACRAEIAVIDGTYDDAVLAAEQAAAYDDTLLLVTDTDYGTQRTVTRDIMAGYALLGAEAWQQMAGTAAPTHVVLQCGVGGMAAGLAAGLWRASGHPPPVVTVEPESAACVLASLRDGAARSVPGDLETRMIGLACGRPSAPALTILAAVTRHSLTVPESVAADVQGALAAGAWGDAPLMCGDTGVAGLAGLWHAATNPEMRRRLDLGPHSRVLAVVSEGPLPASAD